MMALDGAEQAKLAKQYFASQDAYLAAKLACEASLEPNRRFTSVKHKRFLTIQDGKAVEGTTDILDT